jgi:hypothetical protein
MGNFLTDFFNIKNEIKKLSEEIVYSLEQENLNLVQDCNWTKPEGYKDYVALTMLLWFDIYKYGYRNKNDSTYYCFVIACSNGCPLCYYHKNNNRDFKKSHCDNCFLIKCTTNSLYNTWLYGDNKESKLAANQIYRKCFNELKRLNDNERYNQEPCKPIEEGEKKLINIQIQSNNICNYCKNVCRKDRNIVSFLPCFEGKEMKETI